MDDLENSIFKVCLENDRTALCHGNIWKCEKWISKNGMVGVTYCIVKLKRKDKKNESK